MSEPIVVVAIKDKDIKEGVATSLEACAIAIAIRRVTSIRPIRVGMHTIELGPWWNPVRITTPPKAQQFIGQIMAHHAAKNTPGATNVPPPRPFSFELNVPAREERNA